jgi:hypothetical protein
MFVRGRGNLWLARRWKRALEFAQRDIGTERLAQLGDAGLVRVASDARLDVMGPSAVVDPGFVTGGRELDGRENRSEVEQDARDAREPDANGAAWPSAYTPRWMRRSRPSASQRLTRSASTPATRSCSCVIRPC